MARHTTVTMPGDGIGNQVLPKRCGCSALSAWTRSTSKPTLAGSAGSMKATPCPNAGPRHLASLRTFRGILSKEPKEGSMAARYVLSEYVQQAMAEAAYDKLEDGTYAGHIPACQGVVAFG